LADLYFNFAHEFPQRADIKSMGNASACQLSWHPGAPQMMLTPEETLFGHPSS
jgi:hypothetical protein